MKGLTKLECCRATLMLDYIRRVGNQLIAQRFVGLLKRKMKVSWHNTTFGDVPYINIHHGVKTSIYHALIPLYLKYQGHFLMVARSEIQNPLTVRKCGVRTNVYIYNIS